MVNTGGELRRETQLIDRDIFLAVYSGVFAFINPELKAGSLIYMQELMQKLSALRAKMLAEGLDAYLIPSGDEFMNEYVPPYARRLEWLTGFTGSAGMAVVLADKAAFFTDGRYTLQAAGQLPQGQYSIFNTADEKPADWLKKNLKVNGVIGLNPRLFSKVSVVKYQAVGKVARGAEADLIDAIWQDKPVKPATQLSLHALEYAGVRHDEKINNLLATMHGQGVDLLLLTAPDSICWLLNIRGRDVPNTPLVLARLLLYASGSGVLFVDLDIAQLKTPNHELAAHLGNNINIQPLAVLPEYLQKISAKNILLDKHTAPYFFYNELARNNRIIEADDPCAMPKACKNQVEVAGADDAHWRDGVAVVKFLHWLENNYTQQQVSEISAAEKLLGFRKEDAAFIEPSFDTIAGFAANGAIIHYKASPETNRQITGDGLFLLDSGGQYLSGTTDITRTIAIGTPTIEQKRNFTMVLKGHIALATASFPEGSSGHQLDALARQYLWRDGLDYDHGTGHGVGSFLGVHEGPQRISKAPNEVALQPGMIISNEPGYYKNGAYGIRIENLVVVQNQPLATNAATSSGKKSLQFRTLSCVPLDWRLIDAKLLEAHEKNWLLQYHEEILAKLSPRLEAPVRQWLQACITGLERLF